MGADIAACLEGSQLGKRVFSHLLPAVNADSLALVVKDAIQVQPGEVIDGAMTQKWTTLIPAEVGPLVCREPLLRKRVITAYYRGIEVSFNAQSVEEEIRYTIAAFAKTCALWKRLGIDALGKNFNR